MITVEGINLGNKPLTNFELEEAAKELNIPNFKGAYMRDQLPKRPKGTECGILNLNDSKGPGSHWVAWYKKGRDKYYFDSFGVQPPLEIIGYLKSPIYYNTDKIQTGYQVICGHLCLYVLKKLSKGKSFQDVINTFF